MVATNLYDSLVDQAYAVWQGHNKLSIDTLLVILPANQRVAFCLSNLYGQVCNGGFAQWGYNGYKDSTENILMGLEAIVSDVSYPNLKNMLLLTKVALDHLPTDSSDWDYEISDDDADALDVLETKFYDIDSDVLDAEISLFLASL